MLEGTTAISGAQASASSSDSALGGLDIDEFLNLLIVELQNQDPLNPMENNEILQQIGQIREIGATSQLTDTLESILLGQSLSNATSLVGKFVKGLGDNGELITGVVDRVSIEDKRVRLHVGGEEIRLENVSDVLPDDQSTAL